MSEPRPRRHFTMLRGFHLADWFTLANAACGMGAVLAVLWSLDNDPRRGLLAAALLIPLALVFDVLDGRVARWRHAQSPLGRELDSLADVVSFGVAPAALAWGAGMHGLWDGAILIYFVCCGVSRLARYNITAEAMSADTGKVTYFEGTPIPSSVLLALLVGVAVWLGHFGDALWFGAVRLGPGELHPFALLFALSGTLMVSKTLRIPKP
ncbi:CDP-diacylglycerol--serine O-phosphatidyltransferase [Coralloluteibacterium thermophilus]|uniref:CDP-diacylglycerol--serine O-phosphatidyltransferase n=1 Tax=Coralloluteibacterium thermophilum TaxID=2707049 RepID=A0ABV9NQJ7_9GAMM